MTSLKTIVEQRYLLNFSKEKLSKNFVRNALRKTQFDFIIRDEKRSIIVINHIIVGMYHIELLLEDRGGLKNFKVIIRENSARPINIFKDSRFNNQYWTKINQESKLKTSHLIDIIMHCHRLNKLKCFL